MLPSPDGNRNNLRLCRCSLWSDIGITCCQPGPTDDTVGGFLPFCIAVVTVFSCHKHFLLRHHVLSPLANWWPCWEEFYLSAELWSPYSTATNISFLGITCCIPLANWWPCGEEFYLSAVLWSPYSTATNISFLGITCCIPRPTADPVGRSFTFLQSCGHRILQP